MSNAVKKAGDKIIPYIKSIENGALKGPISLHILVTDYCANKCNMCSHWKTKVKKEIDASILEELWAECNRLGIESVCLTGGDPLSHNYISEILKFKRNFNLGIITAGNFPEGFDYELLRDLAWIRFSVDSLKDEVYQQIRGRNNLNIIVKNVLKTKYYNQNIGINFTMQRMNYKELPDMIDFVLYNKLKRLIAFPCYHAGDLELTANDKEHLKYLLISQMNYMYGKHDFENNFEFLLDELSGNVKFKKPHIEVPCIINKIHLAIGTNGNVYPCETILDDTDEQIERDCTIGNIYIDDLKYIWNENYYKEFISEKCQYCYSRYCPINEKYDEMKGKKVFI